jgi:Tfp pilus assembly protein PilN
MINLLPPSIKESRRFGRKNISLFGYSIALLATAVVTAVIMIAGIQFIGSDEPILKTKLQTSQDEITILEKDIQGIETIATRLETAKNIKAKSISFSELIPKIAAVLPDGVVLNALTLTGGVTDPLKLDIDLRTADLGPVTIRNLVESKLFEAADIATLTPKGEVNADGSTSEYQANASITASFTGTADAARKAAAAEAAKKAAADAAAAQASTDKKGAQ